MLHRLSLLLLQLLPKVNVANVSMAWCVNLEKS